MQRYAIYYAPRPGPFADAAAAWLGWNAQAGKPATQPEFPLPRPLSDLTAEPRKYGFHGTLRAPFRLAPGVSPGDLERAVAALAAQSPAVEFPGLAMINLQGFLALVPTGDAAPLTRLAAQIVCGLEAYRAPLTAAETARRRPDCLTPRQNDLLALYGYPFVLEQFQFHLTLTGRMTPPEHPPVAKAARAHFAGLLPVPFTVPDLCLMGEDAGGWFHLLHRYPLAI